MKLLLQVNPIGNGIDCNDENQVKAGPDKDREKKRTRWASSMDASPNYVRYRLICSIVLVLSWLVNLVNSRSL